MKRCTHLRKGFIPLLGLLLMALLSACSGGGTVASATSTRTTTAPASQTPPPAGSAQTLQLLAKAVQATSQVKFVHIDVVSHGTLQSSGGAIPLLSQPQATPYTLKLSAAIAVASQQEQGQLRFVLNPKGPNPTAVKATEIVSGKALYYRVLQPKGQSTQATAVPGNTPPVQGTQATTAPQWAIIDLGGLVSQEQVVTGGIQAQDLLTILTQNVTIADKGIAMVNGAHLHRLTVTLSQQNLTQLAASSAQPMIKQLLSSLQLQSPLEMELFIDEGTSLLQRVTIKIKTATINVDQVRGIGNVQQPGVGGQSRTLQVSMSTTITFSQYNQPVQITIPGQGTAPVQGTVPLPGTQPQQ